MYGLFESVAGRHFDDCSVDDTSANTHFALKTIREGGLLTSQQWYRRTKNIADYSYFDRSALKILENLHHLGLITKLTIVGITDEFYCLTDEIPILQLLEADTLPVL